MNNYTIYNVGIYVRLSRDDGTDKESESIQNQKAFLMQYVIKSGFNLVDVYIDDGWSGTNFERPEFQRLLKDIENGKINCVVTKDLSRLGRDYIMTGHYLERYFPLHNIRYIAVNDGIDTFEDNTNNDMTPFKAVFNDMYAKDISKKIRTALITKKENGIYAGSLPPYGYKIDPNQKGHLIIDCNTASVVERIFYLFLNGKTKLGIANLLSFEKIPTPSQEKNINLNQRFKGVWNEVMIGQILTNPIYAGHLAQGKYKKINYKLKTKITLPKEDWIIIPNTHEPIISQEVFDMVQRIINTKSYSKKEAKPHLLSGFLRCGDCKGPMTYTTNAGIVYIVCRTWRSHAKLKLCTSHSIREDFVNNKVISILREQIKMHVIKDKVVNKAMKDVDNNHVEKQLETYSNRIDEINNIISNLYMDKVKGIVSETDFLNMSNQLNEERINLTNQITELKHEKEQMEESDGNKKYIENQLEKLLQLEEPERNIILQLVNKVEIYNDKKVKVYFNFKL